MQSETHRGEGEAEVLLAWEQLTWVWGQGCLVIQQAKQLRVTAGKGQSSSVPVAWRCSEQAGPTLRYHLPWGCRDLLLPRVSTMLSYPAGECKSAAVLAPGGAAPPPTPCALRSAPPPGQVQFSQLGS